VGWGVLAKVLVLRLDGVTEGLFGSAALLAHGVLGEVGGGGAQQTAGHILIGSRFDELWLAGVGRGD
jgi:hypothetical protein